MSGSAGDQPAAVRRPAGSVVPPRIAVSVGLALLALLLGACSSGAGTPSTLPATTTASSPTVSTGSPSPSASSDEAQIEAAVRSYFAAVNAAIQTGDTSGLDQWSSTECPCRKLIDSVRRVFKDGSSRGAEWAVKSVSPGPPHAGKSVVAVKYRTSAYKNVDRGGRTLETFPAYEIESAVLVVLEGDEWLIRDFDTLSRTEV